MYFGHFDILRVLAHVHLFMLMYLLHIFPVLFNMQCMAFWFSLLKTASFTCLFHAVYFLWDSFISGSAAPHTLNNS